MYMDARKSNKKNKKTVLVIVVTLFIIIGAVLVFTKIRNIKTTDKKDNFNANTLEKQVNIENEDKIYKKTKSTTNNSAELEKYIQNNIADKEEIKVYKEANRIISYMTQKQYSKAEQLLNHKAVNELGYAFDTEPIQKYMEYYQDAYMADNIGIIPYTVIPYKSSGYAVCMLKIAPEIIYDNGESGYDYKHSDIAMFTIYYDGTFLPFNIRDIANVKICIISEQCEDK